MSGRREDIYLWEFSKNAITKHSNFLRAPLGLYSHTGSAAEVERKQSINNQDVTGRTSTIAKQQLGGAVVRRLLMSDGTICLL